MAHITNRADILVGTPLSRETIRSIAHGYLATCYDTHCEWQGAFPSATLAFQAVENHWANARRNEPYHFGPTHHGVVALEDAESARNVDEQEIAELAADESYTPADGDRLRFPRTTERVPAFVERGDLIGLPPERVQQVVEVRPTRSLGLPTWSVIGADPDVDVTQESYSAKYHNELIAREDGVYCRFGQEYLGPRAFTVEGQADHQGTLDQFAGGDC